MRGWDSKAMTFIDGGGAVLHGVTQDMPRPDGDADGDTVPTRRTTRRTPRAGRKGGRR